MRDGKLHSGHRNRMKEKIEKFGLASLGPHEAMEVALYSAIPRRDVNELAHKLVNTFGTVENVFNANKNELLELDGVGESTVFYLKFISELYRLYFNKQKPAEKVSVKTSAELVKLFRKEIEFCNTEELYVCFADSNLNFVNFVRIDVGGMFNVSKNIKEIRRVVENSKEQNVILIHTHPNSSPNPTEIDNFSTKTIMAIVRMAQKEFRDHIIVSASEFYSYKDHDGLKDFEMGVNNIIQSIITGNF